MQVESAEELSQLKALADAASQRGEVSINQMRLVVMRKSEKHWTLDPQGLAWEHYFTMVMPWNSVMIMRREQCLLYPGVK